jgi:23S rRNA (uracil1939-C5)-methyltransferase
MHLSEEVQRSAHVEHARAAIPSGWPVLPITSHVAHDGFGYRTRARVHVRGERGQAIVGLYASQSHEPVTVDACAVLDRNLETARRLLPGFFAGSEGRGEVRLALGKGRGAVLSIGWKGTLAPELFGRLERAILDGHLAGAELTLAGASKPARFGDPTPWIEGADDQPLRLAPGGFGQAGEAANRVLARRVAAIVRPWKPQRAVELYCGAGNLSVLLAREVNALVCVEADGPSCAAARENLARRSLSARVIEGDASDFRWPPGTKLVVLDPPRAGARAVADRLATSRVPYVVYVSCDAPTLARDLGILRDLYLPVSVDVLEMFPQTSHAEIVVALERRRS